jgi:transposase-like protein
MEKRVNAKVETGALPAAGEAKKDKEADEGRACPQAKRYGEAVKRLVVEQIESGRLTVAQAQRQHGIAGAQTVRAWQAKYGKEGGGVRRNSALAAAQAQIGRLKAEKAELERAVGRLTVKSIVLECAMEEGEVQYGEDFKKKFASVLSSIRADASGRKG